MSIGIYTGGGGDGENYGDDGDNDASEERPSPFGGRLRNVLYSMEDLEAFSPYLVQWPDNLPMPVPGSTILDLGKGKETTAYGGFSNSGGIEVLLTSEFSGHSNWAARSENPANYFHLDGSHKDYDPTQGDHVELADEDYISGMDDSEKDLGGEHDGGPTDEDLNGWRDAA